MTRIGFIGLGTMGARVAENLQRADYPMTMFDPNSAAVETFETRGASAAASPAEVARNADIIFLSLPDSPDVMAVATGPEGILTSGHPGLVVIDLSTVAPMVPRRLAAEFQKLGMDWLDAPVSGGPKGAAAGTLTIMVGGTRSTFDRCRPVFDAIGTNIQYMGGSGTGATTKVVNQLAVGIETMAMFEAFTLG
ncbi:MAG: NAD(P)-dependent oxidoreductase, partial [Bradyrhizobium sp.]